MSENGTAAILLSLSAQTMSENGTAANIPASENVSATVENNSTVSTGDLQHSASTGTGTKHEGDDWAC
ncbi:hypothetical protein KY285_026512 [Solanum tuberosum]|nr:hypothetical protein KY285_026512 [Solanum tuberosum]